jgi:hypothetical protein
MWMDVTRPGALRDRGDVAVDRATVEGLAVVAHQQEPRWTRTSSCSVVLDQLGEDRVERHRPVVLDRV